MTNENVVPIRTGEKQPEAPAQTANGEQVTLRDCERLLAAHQGFEHDLIVSDTAFKVVMRHSDPTPEEPIGLFLVVNDGIGGRCGYDDVYLASMETH